MAPNARVAAVGEPAGAEAKPETQPGINARVAAAALPPVPPYLTICELHYEQACMMRHGMMAAPSRTRTSIIALICRTCNGDTDVTGIWLCAGGSPPRICSGTAPMALRGLNWFGFETGATIVDGLWAGPTAMTLDFITILRRIRLLGFNTIRLPMSLKVGGA